MSDSSENTLQPVTSVTVIPPTFRDDKGRFLPGSPGRPPGSKNYVSEELRDLLSKEHAELNGQTGAQAIARRYLEIALKGKHGVALAACDSVVDRVEGKPVQASFIQHSVDDNTMRRIAELAERLLPAGQ